MSGNCRIFADMKREVYESQKAFAGEKKPSMLRRCVGHDYTERMMYMVTMVTEGRRPLFGTVVGRSDAPADSAEAPRIELSALGQRVSDEWMGIPKYYPQVEIIALQMMPDHLHGIIFIKDKMEKDLSRIIRGFKTGCNRSYRELVLGVSSVATQSQQTVQTGFWHALDTDTIAKLPKEELPKDTEARPATVYLPMVNAKTQNSKKSGTTFIIKPGLGQEYALRFRYKNTTGSAVKARMTITDSKRTVLVDREVSFPPTPPKFKMLSTTTGTQINAGTYTVKIDTNDIEFKELEIQ